MTPTAERAHLLDKIGATCRWGSTRQHPPTEWVTGTVQIVLPFILLALMAGCGVLQAPQKVVGAIVPGKGAQQPDPLDLQLQLQRYTDDFMARTSQALDEYARQVGTDEAQVEALRHKLNGGASLVSIASGPNPNANLLDLVSVTALTRRVIEDRWLQTTNDVAVQPWLDVTRVLETNVWMLADRVLSPAQVDELRQGINQWYEQNPEARGAFLSRPREFSALVRTSKEKGAGLNSVFSLVSLDPTAGLDPAVREVTRTRLFAERAMFTMQRMPFLLRMQTELLTYELAEQSAVQLALTNTTRISDSAERLSRAAETVSQTAALLPDRISAERQAILSALDQQEGKLRDLSAEVTRTLGAGEKMSTSLNATLVSFDALMKRFGVGEPTSAPPDTNSPPFNILDYARTAEQIAAMSQQLDALIKDATGTLDSPAIDKRLADLAALLNRAQGHGKSLLNHAFLLAAGLILLGFACATTYRWTAKRRTADQKAFANPE